MSKLSKFVGYCGQENHSFQENTVYENLCFFSLMKDVEKHSLDVEVELLMNKLRLSHFKNTLVSKLSGGNKRKLSIAIALLNSPKILIMDEPTSGVNFYILLILKLFIGLDSVGRREYWEIIKDLKKEKRSIIFTTQFLDEAEELADRIAVLSHGKTVLLLFNIFLSRKINCCWKC